MNSEIEKLLQLPNTWQARKVPGGARASDALPSGQTRLDQALHLGGWPKGATTELLQARPGCGELQLCLPGLQRLQQQAPWLVLIDPPFTPFAPAMLAQGIELERLLLIYPESPQDLLWSAAQCLQSGSCSAVLTWSHRTSLKDRDLRRLQQAAATGQCWHWLMRSDQCAQQASPSALRIKVQRRHSDALHLNILKQRGGWSGQTLQLESSRTLPDGSALQRPVHFNSLPSHPTEKNHLRRKLRTRIHHLHSLTDSSSNAG